MAEHGNVRIDSAELRGLWANFLADSMAKQILTYFQKNCEDPEIKALLIEAITLSETHLSYIADLFRDEGIALPNAFAEKDVNPDAPRLFSDEFYLYYLENMVTMGLTTYSDFLAGSSRGDICDYVSTCLSTTVKLYRKTNQLLQEKGLEIRAPYIEYPSKSKFVDNKQFLAGWWGEQRPLSAAEIANLFVNLHSGQTCRALFMAFAQITQNEEVKDFMKRGKAIVEKHIEIYSGYLKESDLPASVSWDNEVGSSTTWTFSDRLMMFQIALLGERNIANFGVSVALSHRRDLAVTFIRLSAELVKCMGDGAKIMIKNQWMEQPPMAIDRESLGKE